MQIYRQSNLKFRHYLSFLLRLCNSRLDILKPKVILKYGKWDLKCWQHDNNTICDDNAHDIGTYKKFLDKTANNRLVYFFQHVTRPRFQVNSSRQRM
jgi:hypothetical protein